MRYIFLVSFCILCAQTPCSAQSSPADTTEKCAPAQQQVGNTTASANFFSNVAKRPGSLAFESQALLKKAKAMAATAEPSCAEGCRSQGSAKIVLRTTPNKYLGEYDDFAHCKALLEQTTAKAIQYQGMSFESSDEFNEWYQDFTSGKGKEGEDLYSRCDLSCSPQYTSTISERPSGELLASTSVICGHARDKSENNYRLTAELHWLCAEK